MYDFLDQRRREAEWMDAPDADPDQLRRSLGFIRRINSLVGYTRATLHHLKRLSRSWKPGEKITLLDCGTGSADIPRAILRWADRRGFDVKILGLDLHAQTAQIAAEEMDSRLTILRGDARNIPVADGGVDYALTNMFLHHLSDEEVVEVLREMNRISRRGVIAADLVRAKGAYFWIRLFTAFSNPMVKHDATASVRQAFKRHEILALRDRGGVEYAQFYSHFGHRFVLAGQRPARDNC